MSHDNESCQVTLFSGYTIVLRVLLEAGFYIDRKDADGWTPLHAAAHWEQFDCCKILGKSII